MPSNLLLAEATGVATTTMDWAHYWCHIVSKYKVMVVGWPDGVLFKNLSSVSNSRSILKNLLERWHSGAMYWRQLTDAEFLELDMKRRANIAVGLIPMSPQCSQRSDLGKKRRCADVSPSASKRTRTDIIVTDLG